MVPDSFTAFFAASAGVTGALIGLLFVAISVGAEATESERRLEFDVRAGRAFSALTDALVVSLFALVPGTNLGSTALVIALVGVASCIALGLMLLRAHGVAHRTRQLVLLGVQALVFVYQAVIGAQLASDPHDTDALHTLTTLTVVFLLIGMARSWQLIGGRDTGLVSAVAAGIRQRKAPADEPPD